MAPTMSSSGQSEIVTLYLCLLFIIGHITVITMAAQQGSVGLPEDV